MLCMLGAGGNEESSSVAAPAAAPVADPLAPSPVPMPPVYPPYAMQPGQAVPEAVYQAAAVDPRYYQVRQAANWAADWT